MVSKVLLALALFACVYAQIDEDQLEKELQNAEFETLEEDSSEEERGNFVTAEEDSSEELTGRKDPKKHRCSCMGPNTCGCCLKPRILTHKFRGCANVTLFAGDDNKIALMGLTLSFEGDQIAQYNVSVQKSERICDRFPGKLNFLKMCLYNNNTYSEEEGLKSCSSIDMIVKNTTAAILRLSCLKYKDNALTFENAEQVDRDSMINLKLKNPISLVKAYFANKEKN